MKSSISRMTLREIKKSKVIQPPKEKKSMVFIIILFNSRFKQSAKCYLFEFPWWCSREESSCQCRGQGFDPWSGKISHAQEQLSLCATRARVPQQVRPSKRSPCIATKSRPCSLQLESLCTATKTPCSQKLKNKLLTKCNLLK